MKVGDIVRLNHTAQCGIVIGFVEPTHPKAHLKVIVLSDGARGIWTAQYCRVVSDNRANEPQFVV